MKGKRMVKHTNEKVSLKKKKTKEAKGCRKHLRPAEMRTKGQYSAAKEAAEVFSRRFLSGKRKDK